LWGDCYANRSYKIKRFELVKEGDSGKSILSPSAEFLRHKGGNKCRKGVTMSGGDGTGTERKPEWQKREWAGRWRGMMFLEGKKGKGKSSKSLNWAERKLLKFRKGGVLNGNAIKGELGSRA